MCFERDSLERNLQLRRRHRSWFDAMKVEGYHRAIAGNHRTKEVFAFTIQRRRIINIAISLLQ